MKKHILSVLFLCLTTSFCYSQIKVSVQGGAGLDGITKVDRYEADFGYRFGVGVEFPLARTWSLQTGLQLLNKRNTADEYSLKKQQSEEGEILFYEGIKAKMNAIYLQLPIKIAKYVPLNKNCGLQISAGPYLAYGIGGDKKGKVERIIKLNNDLMPQESTASAGYGFNYKRFDKNFGMKRLDIGLSAGVDFKYKSFFIGAGVEYGLLPINKRFLKDELKGLLSYVGNNPGGPLNDYRSTTSPHNYGVEVHVGYCFKLGK